MSINDERRRQGVPDHETVSGMNAIDRAIADLLAPLNDPSWHLHYFEAHGMRVQPIGGDAANIVTDYTAVLKNEAGLQASGDGNTVGDAIAMAFVAIQKQALASTSWTREATRFTGKACTYKDRETGAICGRAEVHLIHPQDDERMGGGKHVYRND
jgi:hypothetical protein